jgi:hypothetical protein
MTEESLDKARELTERMKRFIASCHEGWESTASDNANIMHNSHDIRTMQNQLSQLRSMVEVLDQQLDAVEMRKTESSFGDAYTIPVAEYVESDPTFGGHLMLPDRVKGSPILIYDLELHTSRESAEEAIKRRREARRVPFAVQVIAGNLGGMKELLCSMLQQIWSISRL